MQAASLGHRPEPADLDTAIDGFIDLGQLACLAHTVEAIALARQNAEDQTGAATLLGIAAGIRARLGMVVPAYERARGRIVDEAGLANMDPVARGTAFEAGRSMELGTAVKTIRQLVRQSQQRA